MSVAGEQALAEFLHSSRRISRVPASVRVSENELLEYLKGCGITARYRVGDARPYICGGRRVSARKLFSIANKYRSAAGLPPMAPTVIF